ncbi:MAG TPA: hypothetical protein VFL13_11355 [Candidatus Baltobacteraceae bacterium]|nr:hypothetical protein [Candidatus Baltobacteraceae bacterium]
MQTAFTFVDVDGNTLKVDNFRYEFPGAADGDDANWLCCRITLHATIKHSVEGFFLTREVSDLAERLRCVLESPASDQEVEFETLEPYLNLAISKNQLKILVVARVDLQPALGPVVEFCFACRPADVALTLDEIKRVAATFPVRKPSL